MLRIPEIEAHPLRSVMRQRGLSQIRLARLLGVSQSTVSQWLSGYRTPPADVQRQLDELQKQILGEMTCSSKM